jgi:hypothetical protein
VSTVSKLDPSVRRSRYERRNLLRYFERNRFADCAQLMRAIIADNSMSGAKKNALASALAHHIKGITTHDSTFDSLPV